MQIAVGKLWNVSIPFSTFSTWENDSENVFGNLLVDWHIQDNKKDFTIFQKTNHQTNLKKLFKGNMHH